MKDLPIDRVIPEEYHCKGKFCEFFSHYLNPLGNWEEPMPFPEHRRKQAEESWLPAGLYWLIRNPFSNFCHHWIGITPLGPRYCWILPEAAGWIRTVNPQKGPWQYSYWSKPNSWFKLPFLNFDNDNWQFYIGWLSRGNFGMALRKKEK